MVILVDFDGTLTVENGDGTWRPNENMILQVKLWLADGHKVKLYTSRRGKYLQEAKDKLREWGILIPCTHPKPRADLYVDDKSKRPEEI